MKRSDFLKRLGLGVGAVVVMPILFRGRSGIKPVYKRINPTGKFKMSNARFIGIIYYDKNGNRHYKGFEDLYVKEYGFNLHPL